MVLDIAEEVQKSLREEVRLGIAEGNRRRENGGKGNTWNSKACVTEGC